MKENPRLQANTVVAIVVVVVAQVVNGSECSQETLCLRTEIFLFLNGIGYELVLCYEGFVVAKKVKLGVKIACEGVNGGAVVNIMSWLLDVAFTFVYLIPM
jgi:hypothetical protein